MDLGKILQVLQAGQIVIAALLTLVIFYVRAQMKSVTANFQSMLLTDRASLINELDHRFYRKAELTDDYPVSRREFTQHEKYDDELHEDVESRLQRYNDRLRSIETSVVDMNVQKMDRREWIRQQQIRREEKTQKDGE